MSDTPKTTAEQAPDAVEHEAQLRDVYNFLCQVEAETHDRAKEVVAFTNRILEEIASQEAEIARLRVEQRRLRDAIVSARWRLAKGRALWNSPCHECDAALERGLTGADIRGRASDLELAALDAPPDLSCEALAKQEADVTKRDNLAFREARAAAIEETAQKINRAADQLRAHQPYAAGALDEVETQVLALIDAPPQSDLPCFAKASQDRGNHG